MSSGELKRHEDLASRCTEDHWVVVGVVTGVHGVRGEVKIAPTGNRLERLGQLTNVTLALPSSKRVPSRVRSYRPYEGKSVGLVVFEGYADRTTAKSLIGAHVLIPPHQSPPLPEGEYYEWQLIGLRVTTTDGRDLGAVEEILRTGANDVYVTSQCLVPATAEVIKDIDLDSGTMLIEPLPGLLDDSAGS